MTAVIWTDVVQMFLYVAGAAVSLFVILREIPGGWAHVVARGRAAGKIPGFRFPARCPHFFTRTYSFWAGVIGGCFLTTASHGTEQLWSSACSPRAMSAKAAPRCSRAGW